jgi:hypothetical protein
MAVVGCLRGHYRERFKDVPAFPTLPRPPSGKVGAFLSAFQFLFCNFYFVFSFRFLVSNFLPCASCAPLRYLLRFFNVPGASFTLPPSLQIPC